MAGIIAACTAVTLPTRRDCCLSAAAAAVWRPLPARAAAYTPTEGSGTDECNYGVVQWRDGLRAVLSSQLRGRVELALTIPCGWLNDPPNIDGLAHLAEHVTLANDPKDLAGFIEERVGELNAFTAEETTTFHLEYDVDGDPIEEVREVLQRFAALFGTGGTLPPATQAIVQQELPRVHAEWDALFRSPSRAALELAAIKRRVRATHGWQRFGRGDVQSLPLTSASELARAVDKLRAEHYTLDSATLALRSPLPLDVAADLLRSTFSTVSPNTPTSTVSPNAPTVRGSRAAHAAVVDGGEPLAVEFPKGGRSLLVAWCVPSNDPTAAVRQKPLAVLGEALTSPHRGSLSSRLREAALSPAVCIQEPVVLTRTVARTSAWSIWQMEVVLSDGAEPRWREALDLSLAAVRGLAQHGVPAHVVRECATLATLGWRYSSRGPTALELSVDLQSEPTAALAVRAGRSFTGPTAAIAAAATAAARHCSSYPPLVTLCLPSLDAAWLEQPVTLAEVPATGSAAPGPHAPRSTLPLRCSPLPESTAEDDQAQGFARPVVELAPANPWVPSSTEVTRHALLAPLRVGSCTDQRGGGSLPACLRASTGDSIGVLQLPGCISGSGVELGSKAALAAVGCASSLKPNGAVLLQLYTQRPQLAYNGEKRGSQAAALAELWRYTLAEAVGVDGALAARASTKWEVTFNPAGVRLAVTGHAERVRWLLSLVLQRMLVLQPQLTDLEAGRAAALLRNRIAPRTGLPSAQPAAAVIADARRAALLTASPAELTAELSELWGSVLAADLLIAGTIRQQEAEQLVADVRKQLKPILPRGTSAPEIGRASCRERV